MLLSSLYIVLRRYYKVLCIVGYNSLIITTLTVHTHTQIHTVYAIVSFS